MRQAYIKSYMEQKKKQELEHAIQLQTKSKERKILKIQVKAAETYPEFMFTFLLDKTDTTGFDQVDFVWANGKVVRSIDLTKK